MKKYITPDIEILSFSSEEILVASSTDTVIFNPEESAKSLTGFKESVQIERASNGYNG